MKRCLPLFMAFTAMLLLGLPTAMGATSTHRPRGTGRVRHETIHRPPRRPSCAHRKSHKSKHQAVCHKQKHKKKHTGHSTHKRAAIHKHPQRPATASGYCPNSNLTPKAGNIESVVAATLCLINDERARFGEQALIEDPRLASAATGHSHDMDARDYFEHVSPGGQTLLMRIQASGFIPSANVGYTLGENIAWGTLWLGTPHGIVQAWMASPGHRANILNSSFRYTGIGVDSALPSSMADGQAGGMYTQDFGTIIYG